MPQPSRALPVKRTLSAQPGPAPTQALKESQDVDLKVWQKMKGEKETKIFKVSKSEKFREETK